MYNFLTVRNKIRIAKGLHTLIQGWRRAAGLPMQAEFRRQRLQWFLDLDEGIDLSIYLLGGYELDAIRAYRSFLRPGMTVFDVGANIGAHTLPLAQILGRKGRVLAFEPTRYAYAKLCRNIALNPEIQTAISSYQVFLVARHTDSQPKTAYSSWPLSEDSTVHEGHRGRLQGLEGAQSATLDEICRLEKIAKVDFAKIDVDGAEFSVLKGWEKTLARQKPLIMMEFAPFAHAAGEHSFETLIDFLRELEYSFFDLSGKRPLPNSADQLRRIIPEGSSRNVLLRAK